MNVLITAVRLGDVAVIQLLLRHDINVNAHQQEVCKSLQFTPSSSSLIIIFVIQQGWSALTMAAQLGHIFVVEVLLQAGADVNARDSVRNISAYVHIYCMKLYNLCKFI